MHGHLCLEWPQVDQQQELPPELPPPIAACTKNVGGPDLACEDELMNPSPAHPFAFGPIPSPSPSPAPAGAGGEQERLEPGLDVRPVYVSVRAAGEARQKTQNKTTGRRVLPERSLLPDDHWLLDHLQYAVSGRDGKAEVVLVG